VSKLIDNIYVCRDCLEKAKLTHVEITRNDTNVKHSCSICKKKTKDVSEMLSKTEWNKRMQEEKEYCESIGEANKYTFTFY
jgi:hypothetical protein